ncbi:galactose-1-phosphate uridylyltransferase [Luteipulveratus sp. YIM 133132]|uniref:Galactose-1-phosphate uridylyltransferase n=1 Tax=Luteipulveratus flavus TaxID=3031728 RepID=A0ABT6C4I4_9MICO|nr:MULTISPECIES: galactose-1-phosphate uridylyltransferase [unclassified Luteipulveratus]MDE9366719.1 galactose-1-phosphate uridylyltransferase [Luteipulveratus sp. YIM 133132]MDF8263650.1 galactose-1-phosphate uridylyltransferase [Luteipulveratus sp. YIM 133296]
MTRRTTGRLADDREIIWYDVDGSPERSVPVDPRDLPHTATSSQMRLDPLTGEWIALASHRQSRTFMPPADECPLCPSRDGRHTEVPSEDYQVVAFENRFPSFSNRGEGIDPVDDGLEQVRAGVGRCEVLCFSSDHDGSFAALTPQQARLVVDAWADRTSALAQTPGVEHIFPFENRGREIGVTLQHPHGQIYGYPFVPPRARTELASARAYAERTGRSLFGDIVAQELADGTRVVVESEHWVAFVPYAARWPMEVHLYPRVQRPDIPSLTDAERDDFARVYLDVLGRFDRLYSTSMPYIAAWQQAPVHQDRDLAWLHLELFSIRRGEDKLKYLAGSESGMGAFIGDVAPEQQAQMLREAKA